MLDVVNDRIRVQLEASAHRLGFEDLCKIAGQRGFCKSTAWCVVHKRACTFRKADVHVAGSPCVDFSRIGKREGVHGTNVLCYLCWVMQRLLLEEPCILHENVPEFSVTLLEHFFSSKYAIQTVVVNAKALGQACDRDRRLTWMLHKEHVKVDLRPWPEHLFSCSHRKI